MVYVVQNSGMPEVRLNQKNVNEEFKKIHEIIKKDMDLLSERLEKALIEANYVEADPARPPFALAPYFINGRNFYSWFDNKNSKRIHDKFFLHFFQRTYLGMSFCFYATCKLRFERRNFSGSLLSLQLAQECLWMMIQKKAEDQIDKKVKSAYRDARIELATAAATARHASTTILKREEIIKYWSEHIYPSNPKLSNEKAGEWLKDTFPDLSVRKLSEYVSQAKREKKGLHPASTV